MPTELHDVAVVGGGIVGATIAYHAAADRDVLVLEAESAAGYHSTGRSAALYAETYGPPAIRALTRASHAFFDEPPAGFADGPLLAPRGTLFVGPEPQRAALEAFRATLVAEGSPAELLSAEAARERVPVLRADASAIAVYDPNAYDIDVDRLLQGFLRGACARGASFDANARVVRLTHDGQAWRIDTAAGRQYAARQLVNAAGAWADELAALAGAARVGLEPRRRSAFLFEPPPGLRVAEWPAVIAGDESWYFKPEAGLLLGSPANADPTHAHDVLPDDLDVAIGIDRIERATTLTIAQPRSSWAGLRSFVADGEPVAGFAPEAPAFFWAAALGGYGIQSSPAFGRLCAALLRGEAVPANVAAQGLEMGKLAPARFER
jgi:D-arginine dehydrogenase